MMPGMQYIPFILLLLLINGIISVFALIHCLFLDNPRFSRRLGLAGSGLTLASLLLWFVLLRGEVNSIIYLMIASPLAVSLLVLLLSYRPKFKIESRPGIKRIKRWGFYGVCTGVLVLLVWFFISDPRIDDKLTYQVHKGMTKPEVLKILGKPHEVQDNDRLWGYYLREFGLMAEMSPFYIAFDEHEKVENTWVQ